MISRRTGLSDQEARARIDDVLNRFATEADRAGGSASSVHFLAAVTALIGAVAAWSAAVLGGGHRMA